MSKGINFLLFVLIFTSLYFLQNVDTNISVPGIVFKLLIFLVITLTFSEFKNVLNKERELSETDYLTGVKNRRGFFKYANLVLKKSRKNKKPVSLIYLDLDNFKQVNDKLGHLKGDTLLAMFSANLTDIIREKDLVARLGGDEFVVLLPETTPDATEIIVKRIQNVVLSKIIFKDLTVTCSIGVVTFVSQPKTINHMLSLADSLMYKVKTTGKNGFKKEVFSLAQ